jgi:N-acyl homoserine lactone hydrolase
VGNRRKHLLLTKSKQNQGRDVFRFRTGGSDVLKLTGTAISSFLAAASLLLGGTLTTTAKSKLPDATRAGFADKLYRLDCGHSLANDESVWTPGENVGRSIEFSSTCWLIRRGSEWLL